ncbi:hypothetical protein LL01C1_45530 [Escherichia coli]|nr:hypothetical protein EC2072C1_23070 [Escherichia coli]
MYRRIFHFYFIRFILRVSGKYTYTSANDINGGSRIVHCGGKGSAGYFGHDAKTKSGVLSK